MTTWSDIVQKNTKSSAAPLVKSVHRALRTTFEKNLRSNNFIILGVEEEEFGDVSTLTNQLFNEIEAFPKPEVLTVMPESDQPKHRGKRK